MSLMQLASYYYEELYNENKPITYNLNNFGYTFSISFITFSLSSSHIYFQGRVEFGVQLKFMLV
jgi:hypothetical protein